MQHPPIPEQPIVFEAETAPRRSLLSRLQASLSRETTTGNFIPEIDGLRFVAIAMVVLFHLNGYAASRAGLDPHASGLGWLAAVAQVGSRGVELFFVISGFILALPFAAHYLEVRPKVNLRKYYLRRLTRIEPPYVLTVIALFALAVLVRGKSAAGLLPHLGASFFYLHNAIYGTINPVIGVAWSLEIEVQFYLLAPLLTRIFGVPGRWLRRAILAAAILLCLVVQSVVLPDTQRITWSILGKLQYFLVGFFLADLFIADWKRSPKQALYWDLVALLGWPALFVLLPSTRFQHWIFPVWILFLYCAAFRGVFINRLFRRRWITLIGGMCYSIYLIHAEVISAAWRFTAPLSEGKPYWLHLTVQSVLVGSVVLLVCGLYFVVLEKPCMRPDWPQQLRRKLFPRDARGSTLEPQ